MVSMRRIVAVCTTAWLQLILIAALFVATAQSLNLKNVAVGKPAMISSLYEPTPSVGTATHATDGDSTKTDLWDLSCTHSDTKPDFPKWWIVDLLRNYRIYQVKVTNRDSFIGRLRNFTIDVFDEHPNAMLGFPERPGQFCHHEDNYPAASETATYTCAQPVYGRYLRIIKWGYWSLVMCEVQVMAVRDHAFYATRAHGLRTQLPPHSSATMVSYIQCVAKCGRDEFCNAYSWLRRDKLCSLYSISPYQPPTNLLMQLGFGIEMGFDLT